MIFGDLRLKMGLVKIAAELHIWAVDLMMSDAAAW
jgi:hypothetical protein